MSGFAESSALPPLTEGASVNAVVDLLGGTKVLKSNVRTQFDVHELLLRGLPVAALNALAGSVVLLGRAESMEKAIGVSLRTLQRRKANPRKLLSPGQSGRVWNFTKILSRATAVFGSRAEAERWLERPAIGLDRRRPIDLLTTAAGTELVEDYLVRIEYGVYT